jgi:hypothetical protein
MVRGGKKLYGLSYSEVNFGELKLRRLHERKAAATWNLRNLTTSPTKQRKMKQTRFETYSTRSRKKFCYHLTENILRANYKEQWANCCSFREMYETINIFCEINNIELVPVVWREINCIAFL